MGLRTIYNSTCASLQSAAGHSGNPGDIGSAHLARPQPPELLKPESRGVDGGRIVAPGEAPAPAREKRMFETAHNYWDAWGEEGAAKGGTLGNAQAAVGAVLAGVTGLFDPHAQYREDANNFQAALSEGIDRYAQEGGKVNFEDPQHESVNDAVTAWHRSGIVAFNRAPATEDFPGGIAATQALESWLRGQVESGARPSIADLQYESLKANQGYATLSNASIAEVLFNHRDWAGHIEGMRNDNKNYYQFVGAYIELQPSEAVRAAGTAAAYGNIVGNPIAYGGIGALLYAGGVYEGDANQRAEGADLATSRFNASDINTKFGEVTSGLLAVRQYRSQNEQEPDE